MNIKNNKRKKESIEKIEKAFMTLLQDNELSQISVSDICKIAQLNRSTFYDNFADIFMLADTIRKNLEVNLSELYKAEIINGFNSNDYLKLFCHIKDNQMLYKTYFKLGYDDNYKIVSYDRKLAQQHFNNRFIEYHMEFFKSGITKIIKMWLNSGCRETPEEMYNIIRSEYNGRREYSSRNKDNN